MKDEDLRAFNRGEGLEGGIHTAVNAWCEGRHAAKLQHGPIASWNTSEITNMSYLFFRKADFNGDISRWDVSNVESLSSTFYEATSFNGDLSRWNVSNVVDMHETFYGATSFDKQLGGAWARSSADFKDAMFDEGSCGSIVGKTNGADGTPEWDGRGGSLG